MRAIVVISCSLVGKFSQRLNYKAQAHENYVSSSHNTSANMFESDHAMVNLLGMSGNLDLSSLFRPVVLDCAPAMERF